MIYVFLADGFEEIEALAPVDILRRAQLPVQTVGVGKRGITGAHGVPVVADLADGELPQCADGIQMVVLPGGMPGTKNLEACAAVKQIVQQAQAQGAFIAAICAAPSVLGHWGVLKGHTAVCYPGFEQDLGCALGSEPVVQSGKVITARGAGVAVDFALALVAALCGEEKSKEIRASIQCK